MLNRKEQHVSEISGKWWGHATKPEEKSIAIKSFYVNYL